MIHELQTGRFGAAIRHLMSIKGPVAAGVSSEIDPDVVLENDRPEYKFLLGTRLCRGVISQIAVAAENSAVGLINTAADLLVVVTSIRVFEPTPAAAAFTVTVGGAAVQPNGVTAGGSRTGLDARYDGYVFGDNAQATMAGGHRAGVSGNIIDQTLGSTADDKLIFPYPFGALAILNGRFGNTSIWVWHNTVNKPIQATIEWYERSIENTELMRP